VCGQKNVVAFLERARSPLPALANSPTPLKAGAQGAKDHFFRGVGEEGGGNRLRIETSRKGRGGEASLGACSLQIKSDQKKVSTEGWGCDNQGKCSS